MDRTKVTLSLIMRFISYINIMPIIRIDYDNDKLNDDLITILCHAMQKIVILQTWIEDVFVYANSSQIKINIAPIEIFIEMSDHKIEDADLLIKSIKKDLSNRKENNDFKIPINLTLIPMKWKIEFNI